MRLFLLAVFSVIFGVACNKSGTSVSESAVVDQRFPRSIGGPVAGTTARQWTDNLLRKKRGAVTSLTLPAAAVSQLLAQSAATGIFFYYGVLNGQTILIPVAGTEEGRLLTAATIHTTAGVFSWEAARACKRANTDPIKAAFEGADALQRLLDAGAQTIRISLGLDDEGQPKMYFSDAAIAEPDLVEDFAKQCPPSCGYAEENF